MRAPRPGVFLLALILGLALAGCVTIPRDFKEPQVALISLQPKIRNIFAPEFDVVLRVTNPNREALEIDGLSYTVDLQGIRVIQGVATELPTLKAYGDTDVRLSATADLAGGLSLLSELMQGSGNEVDFELNADIDLGTFYPMVRIKRNGVIALQ